jgi:hypothetical protein
MILKRYTQFVNESSDYDFDFDFVYQCFRDLLEDDKKALLTDKLDPDEPDVPVEPLKCKISKKKFSTMDYAVIDCEDITILGEYGNITEYRRKKLTDKIRKVTHNVTDDICISLDDYVDLINKGTYDGINNTDNMSDREFKIYDELLRGFNKLRDVYPEYTYMFVKKGGSQESTLSLEIYPEY